MRTVEAPSGGARRVVVMGSRHWAAVHVVHDALSQAWAGGGAVLVTSTRPTVVDRYAELLWRRWGGRVEREAPGWRLHQGRGGAARRTWDTARLPGVVGADVSVCFTKAGVQLSEHDRTASALDSARTAMQPHHDQHQTDPLPEGKQQQQPPRRHTERPEPQQHEQQGEPAHVEQQHTERAEPEQQHVEPVHVEQRHTERAEREHVEQERVEVEAEPSEFGWLYPSPSVGRRVVGAARESVDRMLAERARVRAERVTTEAAPGRRDEQAHSGEEGMGR
jgi:hypothetical protein